MLVSVLVSTAELTPKAGACYGISTAQGDPIPSQDGSRVAMMSQHRRKPSRTITPSFGWMTFANNLHQPSWLVREYLELDSLAAIFGDSERERVFWRLICPVISPTALLGAATRSTKGLSCISPVKVRTD